MVVLNSRLADSSSHVTLCSYYPQYASVQKEEVQPFALINNEIKTRSTFKTNIPEPLLQTMCNIKRSLVSTRVTTFTCTSRDVCDVCGFCASLGKVG